MKYNDNFQNLKEKARKVVLYSVFANLCNVCFIEDSWILPSVSALPVAIYCFDWSMWRKSPSHWYGVGKGRNILSFLFNDGYSLILYQNLTCGSFLKVSCSVWFEILSMSFLYSVTLKSDWPVLHSEWTL